uniref:30S ribosomal protein S16 n=1 Tax=Globodera pallida TaxID=36090 RepID=A0A183CNE4_GLOPA
TWLKRGKIAESIQKTARCEPKLEWPVSIQRRVRAHIS